MQSCGGIKDFFNSASGEAASLLITHSSLDKL